MKRIRIKINGKKVLANYVTSFELIDGLFLDMAKPMLLDFPWLLRPVPISTRSRYKKEQKYPLPFLQILTFDKERDIMRNLKFCLTCNKVVDSIGHDPKHKTEGIPNELNISMFFKEKFVLEIPLNLDLPKELFEMKRLEFEDV